MTLSPTAPLDDASFAAAHQTHPDTAFARVLGQGFVELIELLGDDRRCVAAKVYAARTGKKDYEVLEEALRRYLGLDVVEKIWSKSDLDEGEALTLAYRELHAHREETRRARRGR